MDFVFVGYEGYSEIYWDRATDSTYVYCPQDPGWHVELPNGLRARAYLPKCIDNFNNERARLRMLAGENTAREYAEAVMRDAIPHLGILHDLHPLISIYLAACYPWPINIPAPRNLITLLGDQFDVTKTRLKHESRQIVHYCGATVKGHPATVQWKCYGPRWGIKIGDNCWNRAGTVRSLILDAKYREPEAAKN